MYAATATFFECLTGHKPYEGDDIAELALQHVDAPVPAEEAPKAVRELIRRGLAKDPRERPAQADAFVGDLEAAAGAAYGPAWEERGRGRLAALVALLPLLLPSACPRWSWSAYWRSSGAPHGTGRTAHPLRHSAHGHRPLRVRLTLTGHRAEARHPLRAGRSLMTRICTFVRQGIPAPGVPTATPVA
ncbi:hypothetical protein BJ965_000685 [Streptomyces luteogriseus]|uniref:Protein kinase domain-containing protein n=1 Tax=Streptomyces luteogriseus TaxID=68233 RepID=A0A7W7DI12_9ACTN|nr:hypothetical protein [Streptomyces luteogriseus]MBB4710803.1 hypothetical protein [Streptomyces luteogriseus]